jgi:hypothetical protein
MLAAFVGLLPFLIFGLRILVTSEVYWGEVPFLGRPVTWFTLGCPVLFALLQFLESIDRDNLETRG